MALSASDKRDLLQSALRDLYPYDSIAYPHSPSPYIRDVFEDSIVYDLGGSLFQVSYTMTDAGKVTLATDTKKVYAKTSYEAIEALRSRYVVLVQETAERGLSSRDIKDVSKECQTILDADEPNPIEAVGALESIENAIEWVRAQEATKTEDGAAYTAEAYGYTPDVTKPSGWRLRLWEDLEKKATVAQLGRAAAAFSPGGFKGKRADVPQEAAAGVKGKIRAAYRKLGVSTDDIPKWIREVVMRERIGESFKIAIQEVTAEGIAAGRLPVRIIVPGMNTSDTRHYTESAVADAGKIFEGSKMYADHQTEAQEEAMPERSIRDWVATLQETRVSESGNAVGIANIHAGWLKEMVANLYEAGNLGQLGTSINCIGTGSKQVIEGKPTVSIEGLQRGTFGSVDFVTEAGAGGQAGLKESAHEGFLDVDLMDLAQLREARPDLVQAIETDSATKLQGEVKEAMKTAEEVVELESQLDTVTKERDDYRVKDEAREAAEKKSAAQATIKEAVDAAKLPDASKARLIARLAESTDAEGVTEAIQSEVDYIAELNEAGKVIGMGGPKKDQVDVDAGRAAYREALKRQHPEWDDKALDSAVTN